MSIGRQPPLVGGCDAVVADRGKQTSYVRLRDARVATTRGTPHEGNPAKNADYGIVPAEHKNGRRESRTWRSGADAKARGHRELNRMK
jgi:hypothetical protein